MDLRGKVIKYLKEGNSQKLTSKTFNIGTTTVSQWWLRYKKEGHFRPRPRLGAKPNMDIEKLKEYIESHPNSNSKEMGIEFGMTGKGVLYWLNKIGYSYKKKSTPMWSPMKKKEKTI